MVVVARVLLLLLQLLLLLISEVRKEVAHIGAKRPAVISQTIITVFMNMCRNWSQDLFSLSLSLSFLVVSIHAHIEYGRRLLLTHTSHLCQTGEGSVKIRWKNFWTCFSLSFIPSRITFVLCYVYFNLFGILEVSLVGTLSYIFLYLFLSPLTFSPSIFLPSRLTFPSFFLLLFLALSLSLTLAPAKIDVFHFGPNIFSFTIHNTELS